MFDSTYRILIVDDVIDNLFLLQAVLETEGYAVECADNGQLAIKKAESFSPHLILLDFMMPGMNGDEVVRRIQASPKIPDIPIFLVTAHRELEATKDLKLPIDEIIYKPIDFENLLRRIKDFLAD